MARIEEIIEEEELHISINGGTEFYETLVIDAPKNDIFYFSLYKEQLIDTFEEAKDSQIEFLRKGYKFACALKEKEPRTAFSPVVNQETTLFPLCLHEGKYKPNELSDIINYFKGQFQRKQELMLCSLTCQGSI